MAQLLRLLFAFGIQSGDGRDGSKKDFGSDLNRRGLTLFMAR